MGELELNGTPGRIRTCDLLLRRQTLYPSELQARLLLSLALGADGGQGKITLGGVAESLATALDLDPVPSARAGRLRLHERMNPAIS